MSERAATASPVSRVLSLARRHPELGPLCALVVVHVLFLALRPETFGRTATMVAMIRQTTLVGIAATGATAVVVVGGIDLSVGSIIALTAVVVAVVLRAGYGAAFAAFAGIAGATLCGVMNGAAVTGLRVPPFIVTLGSMSILRGVAKGLADERTVSADARGLDNLTLPSHGLFGLPIAAWLMLAVAVAVTGLLRNTRFGRYVFAIGSNERTARLCGVDVARVKIGVYALAGLVAGLSGVVEFATLSSGDPTDSMGRELDVIASVVIGGASLDGGEGSVIGALIGAFLMTEIRTGCNHLGLSNWVQEIVTGVIIVTAVALDQLRKSSASR